VWRCECERVGMCDIRLAKKEQKKRTNGKRMKIDREGGPAPQKDNSHFFGGENCPFLVYGHIITIFFLLLLLYVFFCKRNVGGWARCQSGHRELSQKKKRRFKSGFLVFSLALLASLILPVFFLLFCFLDVFFTSNISAINSIFCLSLSCGWKILAKRENQTKREKKRQ
jgi:hypothetical protein